MKQNRYTFGIGTIGRDMLYSLISMYYIFYLTDVLVISVQDLWWVTGIMVGLRIFDALNDPVMGVVVDNTRTRWGKHKPWIAVGAFLSGIFTIVLFVNPNMSGARFVLLFTVIYALWGISFTINDISYWSMLPSLSKDQKERENIGSKARIFALVGMFFVVAGIVPITEAIGNAVGSLQKGYFIFSIGIVCVMWIGQLVTLIGVKQSSETLTEDMGHTSLRGMFRAIFRNDQLLLVAISMALFMIGYVTTTSFGIFYFQYVYGDIGMYSIFAVVLGISQIVSLVLFPFVSKFANRKTIYLWATILVVAGYVVFFFAPTGTMLFVGIAGVLLFVGQAGIQLLMLLFLADTVEYGQWKLGKRNESVTFSLQPFINKIGGAVASGIVGVTVIISGIKEMPAGTVLGGQGLYIFKIAMLILPLLCILGGFVICHFKYAIDEVKYEEIVEALKLREKE
jgi:melibiose permease/lactose/raffinose/galactose permease